MKYSQGKLQSIIYRSKNAALSIIAFSVVGGVWSIFGLEPSTEFMKIYILGVIIVPVLITLWLIVFNSGKSSVDEYAIEFTGEGINYLHMAEKERIVWTDYDRYEVSGILRRTLTVHGKAEKLSIDLMLFSSWQRKQIISTLNESC